MEPRRNKFNSLRKKFQNFKLISRTILNEDSGEEDTCLFDQNHVLIEQAHFTTELKDMREEYIDNLRLPLSEEQKNENTNDIIDFLKEIDGKISETEDGSFKSQFFNLMAENDKSNYILFLYNNFLKVTKQMIGKEISFYYNLYKSENHSTGSFAKVEWKKSKVDLVELITALHEIRAFTINDNYPSRIELARTLSELFHFPIKGFDDALSNAVNRSEKSPFLTNLKFEFDEYWPKSYK